MGSGGMGRWKKSFTSVHFMSICSPSFDHFFLYFLSFLGRVGLVWFGLVLEYPFFLSPWLSDLEE
jgi:hypothetical protein